ncbi:MAG: hypothetical protein IT378_23990 [Sandaracinaceae bacterium]|nr:hypothetical protein [Sandaracinaceae bacterium]
MSSTWTDRVRLLAKREEMEVVTIELERVEPDGASTSLGVWRVPLVPLAELDEAYEALWTAARADASDAHDRRYRAQVRHEDDGSTRLAAFLRMGSRPSRAKKREPREAVARRDTTPDPHVARKQREEAEAMQARLEAHARELQARLDAAVQRFDALTDHLERERAEAERPIHLLVLDADPHTHRLLAEMARPHGERVRLHAALDVAQARQWLAHEGPFDRVLCGWSLDANETAEAFARELAGRGVSVTIALALFEARTLPLESVRALEALGVRWIPKPARLTDAIVGLRPWCTPR